LRHQQPRAHHDHEQRTPALRCRRGFSCRACCLPATRVALAASPPDCALPCLPPIDPTPLSLTLALLPHWCCAGRGGGSRPQEAVRIASRAQADQELAATGGSLDPCAAAPPPPTTCAWPRRHSWRRRRGPLGMRTRSQRVRGEGGREGHKRLALLLCRWGAVPLLAALWRAPQGPCCLCRRGRLRGGGGGGWGGGAAHGGGRRGARWVVCNLAPLVMRTGVTAAPASRCCRRRRRALPLFSTHARSGSPAQAQRCASCWRP
jgi:hypothetical protein